MRDGILALEQGAPGHRGGRGTRPGTPPGGGDSGSIRFNSVQFGSVGPGEEVLGQLAVLEALVELLADGQREPLDFAVTRHRAPWRAWHYLHAGRW